VTETTFRSRPLVSICMPTHQGRAAKLDRALRSIAAQYAELPGGTLQVCVSDNGSQDDTQSVLRAHAAGFGGDLKTSRFEENRGFTANLLKAVDLADGDYCWLMGSDDEIEPGGIAVVLAALDDGEDLSGLTLNRRNVDDDHPENTWLDDPSVLPPAGRAEYTDAEQVFAELAMLQDYISTQVVHRERWGEAVAGLGPEGIAAGLNFPHLPILGSVIRKAPRWRWVDEPIVRHRLGMQAVEDTFDGGLTRYTITVTTDRARIWRSMFGARSSLYRQATRNIWHVQASRPAVLHLKLQPGQTLALDLALLRTLTRYYWFIPGFWRETMPALIVPHQLISVAAVMVRGLRAARRWRSQR
jgi:abequosyltransferase